MYIYDICQNAIIISVRLHLQIIIVNNCLVCYTTTRFEIFVKSFLKSKKKIV